MAFGGAAVQMPLAVTIAIAFIANIVAELTVVSLRLKDRTEARLEAAEVIESEVWQYCLQVPAAYQADDDVAALNLRENVSTRLAMLSPDLPGDALNALDPTEAMTELRSSAADERHNRYVSERIAAISDASEVRSRHAESRLLVAQAAILVLLFAGGVCAIARAAGQLEFNVVGLVLASVGAITGWLQFGAFTTTESTAKSNYSFLLKLGAQAERMTKDSDAWFDVVRRIETRVAPTGLS
jgi:hypothetical protein